MLIIVSAHPLPYSCRKFIMSPGVSVTIYNIFHKVAQRLWCLAAPPVANIGRYARVVKKWKNIYYYYYYFNVIVTWRFISRYLLLLIFIIKFNYTMCSHSDEQFNHLNNGGNMSIAVIKFYLVSPIIYLKYCFQKANGNSA